MVHWTSHCEGRRRLKVTFEVVIATISQVCVIEAA